MKLPFLLSLLMITSLSFAKISVVNPKLEGLTNPLGIDVPNPRFSWSLEVTDETDVKQIAYQIEVSSSKEFELIRWSSGKVKSDESLWIPYRGETLNSNAKYFWRVKSWTNKGETSWSKPSFWSMGLLTETDWSAQWIGMDKAMPWDSETQWSRLSARYLRKEFTTAKEISRATVHLSGLGMYELWLNGSRIGEQVLAPAPTDYRESVMYTSFDVTSNLQNGENAIGVVLGNGRYYTMRQAYKPYKIANFGYPKLRFVLIVEYVDGSSERIRSDASWKLNADGPIRSNNEYDGEEYDARKEFLGWTTVNFDDSSWQWAQRVSIPKAPMVAQKMAGMKVLNRLSVKNMIRKNDKYILDFGQNTAGWMKIKVKGDNGDTVTMRFSEIFNSDSTLYVANLRDARVTDKYILKGDPKGENWSPTFVYHGFRYAEVSGLKDAPNPEDFILEVIADEMTYTGEITTSNPVLNKVLENAWWGIQSNYKGMPVDCPQRNERQPWLGDRTMGSLGESFFFDNRALYDKWAQDIVDAQLEDGSIPDVAPAYWNYYSNNVTWPAALPMTMKMLYEQYGDQKPIIKYYPAVKKWMNLIRDLSMDKQYVVNADKYGDWCVPPESPELIHSKDPARKTPGDLISTAYYYYLLGVMADFAQLQGLDQEVANFKSLAVKVAEGFNQKFFDAEKGHYGNGSTTSNLLALSFGLVEQDNQEKIRNKIVSSLLPGNMPSINSGVIGIQWLMRELSGMGRGDVAFALASSSRYPSWGYMVSKGATTIWELWNGDTANPSMNSANHVMLLGDLIPWAFENLGGIQSAAPGFKKIVLKPDFSIDGLDSVSASYSSPYGFIKSKWRKTVMNLKWDVVVPPNTVAEIHFPSGKVLHCGSGTYHFDELLQQAPQVVSNEFIYESATFPSCHSATIAELQNGDLVTAFFGGTREGHPDVCIWVSRKTKGATGWSKPQLAADGVFTTATKVFREGSLIQPDSTRKACYNPVLYEDENGRLNLFYKIGSRVSDWTGFITTSDDQGKSWSKSFELPEGYLGPIKNKVVDLPGRKSIAPSSTEGNGWKVHFEIAEDGGRRIRKVGPLQANKALLTQDMKQSGHKGLDIEGGDDSKQNTIQAIQPSILKHKDGRLQILCRTRNGKLATAWSADQGETWTPLSLSNIPNNNSGTDAETLQDGRFALVYNPVETKPGEKKGPRTPLAVAISNDGLEWTKVVTLEDSPVSQYSYPSIIQGRDGRIHIVYTWRRERIKYVELKL